MIHYVIDETHLQKLSISARRELLKMLENEMSDMRERAEACEWRSDRDLSFPLTLEQALQLIQGEPEHMQRALYVFVEHITNEVGRASLDQLMKAAAYPEQEQLSQDFASLTKRMKAISGDDTAWLLNWRAEDWNWNAKEKRYDAGEYFISGPAIHSLRVAFEEIHKLSESAG